MVRWGEDGRQEAGKREREPIYDPVANGEKGKGWKTGSRKEGANLVVSGEKGRGWKTGSREREREPIHDPVVSGE